METQKQIAQERPTKLIMQNKKALFDFEIITKIEAGIVLKGTEVKSLRNGKCNFADTYAAFKDKYSYEMILYNFQISEYEFGNIMNHDPKRLRKLLINFNEAKKFKIGVTEKGYTIVPTKVYFSGHLVKVELALVKPKKLYDKREVTKDREVKRSLDRITKNN